MIKGAKVAEPAELLRIDLQLFAEGEGGGGAPAGGDTGAAPAANMTSSVIPGDDYASGGPEPPDNQLAEMVDFDGFDFNDDGAVDGDPEAEPDPTPEADPVPDPVKKEQSPEANTAFAEIRRKAEQAEKELHARDAWVEQNFGASHGLKTWEQYQAAIEHTHQQQEQARQQEIQTRPQMVAQQTYQQLIQQGYDEAVARELANARGYAVEQSLRNQALTSRLDAIENQSKQQQEQSQQQTLQQQQEAHAKELLQSWESDRAKLAGEYGDLVPKDLNNLDQAVIDKLQKGYSFEDAWYTTNRSKIVEQREKAAAQKTLNNLNSKSHLKTEGDGAGDSNASTIPLPADTLQMYMDSGMTEKQARAFHKKLYG